MASDNPILNSPYDEPLLHYATDDEGALDYSKIVKGRRIFTPDIQVIPVKQGPQQTMFAVNERAAEYGHALDQSDPQGDRRVAQRQLFQYYPCANESPGNTKYQLSIPLKKTLFSKTESGRRPAEGVFQRNQLSRVDPRTTSSRQSQRFCSMLILAPFGLALINRE